jgi:hypothetical protein
MKIKIGRRDSGKTVELIKQSAETGYYIICFSNTEANRVAKVARDMGLKIPYPLSAHEFMSQQYFYRGIKGFLIDNIDLVFNSMSSVPIIAATLTPDAIEEIKPLSDAGIS